MLKFSVQIASKNRYPTKMLYFLTEHTLIIYVQLIIGSRKTSSVKEKSFENDSEDLVTDSIFKRLSFDYSSSETVSNTLIRAIFLVNVYSWYSDQYKSILTRYNEK